MPGRRARPQTATEAATRRLWTDAAEAIARYQRERNTQPVADPGNTPYEWRAVTYTNAIVPDNAVDPAGYANVVYRFNTEEYFAVAGAPARCHKEPQATTPKGEFEMDAD